MLWTQLTVERFQMVVRWSAPDGSEIAAPEGAFFALVAGDGEPSADDWRPAAMVRDLDDSRRFHLMSAPYGPLAPRTYRVWAKLQDNPEIKVWRTDAVLTVTGPPAVTRDGSGRFRLA